MGTIITVLNGITQCKGQGREEGEKEEDCQATLDRADNTYKSIASTQSATAKVNDITINIERFTFLRGDLLMSQ